MLQKRKWVWIWVFIFSINNISFAQKDSSEVKSIGEFLKNGKVGGSSRTYFMATDNEANLQDFSSLAIGAGISYQTPKFKGFSAGMSGYFISNLHSSNFEVTDESTQNPSRYELGLFDVTNPENKYQITRLEELWVKFEHKNSKITLGRYVPNNLFINGQDGRMRPTMVQGLLLNTAFRKTALELQLINKISPRSTVNWYSVAESFGIYPTGKNPNGTPSNYFNNTTTPGIVIFQLTNTSIKNTRILAGEITVPNVFQTYYFNPEFSNKKFFSGLMLAGQHPIGNGGSDILNNKYANSTDKSLVISAQVGKRIKKHSVDFNYTRIYSSGRFLMPREWGRDPFYTFMPRERNEGLGSVNAISTNIKLLLTSQFKSTISYGMFLLPDPSNSLHNKYVMPSYNQFNVLLSYAFKNSLQGLTVRSLYVRKDALEKQIENPNYIFNKVNMSHFNLILDFSF